jgi:hypothetical protein
MNVIRIIIAFIAVLVGGWLTFDGTRALLSGDYVTPRSGSRAGQLGPWAKVISAVGVDPRSTTVKCVHVALGLLWLMGLSLFLTNTTGGRSALIGCSVFSLWYLPFGTVLGALELVLLFLPVMRGMR